MRAVKYILIGILTYGCAVGDRDTRSAESTEQLVKSPSIDEDIERAMLDPDAVNAFELQSIDKFHDLLSYLKVTADTSLNQLLRDEAQAAIDVLFINPEGSKSIALTQNEKDKATRQLTSDANSIKEIIFATPFRQLRPQVFAGEITYLIKESDSKTTLNVYLLRFEKLFGEEKHLVWEIKFGHID